MELARTESITIHAIVRAVFRAVIVRSTKQWLRRIHVGKIRAMPNFRNDASILETVTTDVCVVWDMKVSENVCFHHFIVLTFLLISL